MEKGVKTQNFLIGKGILPKICDFANTFENIALVFDSNTFTVCGEQVKKLLLHKTVCLHVFERDGVLIPDECAISELEGVMPQSCDLIVGVGSGVINDICKFVSFQRKIEYIIVATAPSMDGYVSKGAAMIWRGMKETFATHTPYAVVADTKILARAPMDMIRAGYGDIIGKYSALCDWKLSALVNSEYFDKEIYDYTMDMVKKTVPLAQKLLERDEESIGVLTEALIGAGIAMARLGNSRPASGSEHHLSHFFEITGIINKTPYLCHGTDVAFATWMTAKMRERILEEKEYLPCPVQKKNEYEKQIRRVYGGVADEVIALQGKMGRYDPKNVDTVNAVYAEKWDQIKQILTEMPTSDEIRVLLDAIGLDISELYKTYSVSHIKDAYRYAKDLKDRYTVLWLYNSIFGDELDNDIPKCIYTGGFDYGHIQGIAADIEKGFIYCSFTTALVKLDLLGNVVGSVIGLIGHLGCLAMGDDKKIYGSLEYKNDAIGKAIANKCKKVSSEESFYIAIFDGDRIDRVNIDAEQTDVMCAIYLPEVLEDYLYTNGDIRHKYGCSGIDGISFGPAFGELSGKKYLCVCYGIYSDTDRDDNDCQVILQFDPEKFSDISKPLKQGDMHKSAASSLCRYFVPTGNTTYGVQNLEFDYSTGAWYIAVYRGKKEKYPNYSMYVIDASVPAFSLDLASGERINVLTLLKDGLYHEESGVHGYDFPYGATGIGALGNKTYYISENKMDKNGAYASNIRLYKFKGNPNELFVKM